MENIVVIEVTEEDIKKGVRADCGKCPIALAIGRHLPEDICVDVKYTYAHFYRQHNTLELRDFLYRYKMPTEAGEFINQFDAGIKVRPIKFTIAKLSNELSLDNDRMTNEGGNVCQD